MMDALLEAERARLRRDLDSIEVPARDWVPETAGTLDVVVVGAGLSGLAIAFGLIRQGIRRLLVLDRAPRGLEGPWRSHARMDILRSPKALTGPDLGVPSLTFRAWYEARRGPAAWDALGKIAREDWADYLLWYRDVLGLPVLNDTVLLGFAPDGAALALEIEGPEGRRVLRTRRLVLATGVDGNGRPHVPAAVLGLPPGRWCHSAAPFEDGLLRGARVAVLGAAASAFDCAVTALRQGAAEVRLLARRAVLPHVEALAWANFPGFMGGLAELDDARRWRFMRRLLELQAPPTAEAFAEGHARPPLHPDAGRAARRRADGRRGDRARRRGDGAAGGPADAGHRLRGGAGSPARACPARTRHRPLVRPPPPAAGGGVGCARRPSLSRPGVRVHRTRARPRPASRPRAQLHHRRHRQPRPGLQRHHRPEARRAAPGRRRHPVAVPGGCGPTLRRADVL
jgi:cation diffusion facilitator CzcD-associated flavoprotein CzcO